MRPRSALLATIALTGLAAAAAAGEAEDSLRAAELAFAASVAERDAERFASFIDPEAVFVGASVLRGREAIVAGWSVFFAEGGPRLDWRPEIVEVRGDGLGLSRGPYTLTATGADGTQTTSSGLFTSIWRRGPDGWKILFDAGCPPCAAAASPEG